MLTKEILENTTAVEDIFKNPTLSLDKIFGKSKPKDLIAIFNANFKGKPFKDYILLLPIASKIENYLKKHFSSVYNEVFSKGKTTSKWIDLLKKEKVPNQTIDFVSSPNDYDLENIDEELELLTKQYNLLQEEEQSLIKHKTELEKKISTKIREVPSSLSFQAKGNDGITFSIKINSKPAPQGDLFAKRMKMTPSESTTQSNNISDDSDYTFN